MYYGGTAMHAVWNTSSTGQLSQLIEKCSYKWICFEKTFIVQICNLKSLIEMAEELVHKAIVAINKPLTQLLNAFPPTLSIPRIFFFKSRSFSIFQSNIWQGGEKERRAGCVS